MKNINYNKIDISKEAPDEYQQIMNLDGISPEFKELLESLVKLKVKTERTIPQDKLQELSKITFISENISILKNKWTPSMHLRLNELLKYILQSTDIDCLILLQVQQNFLNTFSKKDNSPANKARQNKKTQKLQILKAAIKTLPQENERSQTNTEGLALKEFFKTLSTTEQSLWTPRKKYDDPQKMLNARIETFNQYSRKHKKEIENEIRIEKLISSGLNFSSFNCLKNL